MRSLRVVIICFSCLTVLTTVSQGAALVSLFIASGNRSLRNEANVALTAGNLGTNFDGAVAQVGYYQTATVGNNFGNGTFVPLTGQGSLFNVNTTIGDSVANGAGNGELFSDRLDIVTGLNGGANDSMLPAANTPLSIRIFNNTTLAASTRFEAVSNNLWLWRTPADSPNNPVINLFFDSVGLVAKSGAVIATPGSNIQTTTTTVPEPTSALLLMVGSISMVFRRRRAP